MGSRPTQQTQAAKRCLGGMYLDSSRRKCFRPRPRNLSLLIGGDALLGSFLRHPSSLLAIYRKLFIKPCRHFGAPARWRFLGDSVHRCRYHPHKQKGNVKFASDWWLFFTHFLPLFCLPCLHRLHQGDYGSTRAARHQPQDRQDTRSHFPVTLLPRL